MRHLLTVWAHTVNALGIVLAIIVLIWLGLLMVLCLGIVAESVRLLRIRASRRHESMRLLALERDAYGEHRRALSPVLLSEWKGRR